MLLAKQSYLVDDVLDRVTLGLITWADLFTTLETVSSRLERTQPGDQTLARLIDGFLAQLSSHRGAL